MAGRTSTLEEDDEKELRNERTGGDGSNGGTGTWFEGAIVTGLPSDATDDAVQANIVAVGYGR